MSAMPTWLQDFDPDTFDTTVLIITIVSKVVFGIVCAALATGRGRSPVGWFFLGMLLDCLGLIVLLVIPNLKEEEAKRQRHEAQTRKLREQLKKERQVADERHQAHDARLGAHDRALGLDTQSPALLQEGAPPAAPKVPPQLPKAPTAEWFYAVDGQQHGPVTGATLRAMWLDEEIPDRSLVWRDGMSGWMPIGKVADLLGGES